MDEFLSEIEYNRLSELLDIVCSNLSEDELQSLKKEKTAHLPVCIQDEIKDGRDLAVVLRRNAVCDETFLQPIQSVLNSLRRFDLLRILYSHERKTVKIDPLEEFLLQEADKAKSSSRRLKDGSSGTGITNGNGKRPSQEYWEVGCVGQEDNHTSIKKRRRTRRVQPAETAADPQDEVSPTASSGLTELGVKSRYTCDVRLRVWAEYCDHERILNENVFSNKVDPLERQLERFSQASSILQSRDLGYIVCDIKFSEITYLDAFWRDYLNGSLLEALKVILLSWFG